MNTRQLQIVFIIFLFASLTLSGTSQAAKGGEITKFAKKIPTDPATLCKAILNINLPQLHDENPDCRIDRGTKIKKIKDPSGCETHYSLYDDVCQCNGSKHSELLVLKTKPNIKHFINLKHPCVSCYTAIVRHMIEKGRLSSGEDLTIEWENTDAATTRQHLLLSSACKHDFK